MTNPYRAMCAELVDALDSGIPAGRIRMSPLAARARALLAQPVAESPADGEVAELQRWGVDHGAQPGRPLLSPMEDGYWTPWHIAADLLQRQHPQPVAVSECLPGDELCWWFEPDEDDGYGGMWTLLRIRGGTTRYTYWLAANALPTPEATNG